MACNIIEWNNPIWAGLIGSAATWIVISASNRIRTLWKFRNLTGEYYGQSMDGKRHTDDKVYKLRYNIINNLLIISQTSTTKGNWICKIPISDWQPLIGMGNFEYKKGKYEGDWGIMQIRVNPDQQMLSIETQHMNSEGFIRYIIRKK